MSCFNCTRWALDLTNWRPTLQQLNYAVLAIQPEERDRIMRFHFFDDFLSSLVGRLLMRKYVSDTSGFPYDQIHFERDERGKPYWKLDEAQLQQHQAMEDRFKTPEELSFNVSHQGNMVILAGITNSDGAIIQTKPNFGIGADVMKIEYTGGKPITEFFRLMHRKFSSNEWQYIMRGCEAQQLKSFMRHWCLKEAYVKELGVGITIDLQKISFTVDPVLDLRSEPLSNVSLSLDDQQLTNWHFEEHLLKPNYCAALAFKNCKPNKVESFQFLNFEDLIVSSSNVHEFALENYCKAALSKPNKRVDS